MMSSNVLSPTKRVVVYIDGFNFYFGMRESHWKCYYWLDFPKLTSFLARKLEDAKLAETKYFTARINAPDSKRRRQNDYLEVLAQRGDIKFYFGNYRNKIITCGACNHPNYLHNEKQTDVNIAVQLIVDAFEDLYDVAIVLSGDSDLVPPIKEVRRLFPTKRILACFPPKRRSKEIRQVCNGEIIIGEADLKHHQLPDEVKRADGHVYRRPEKWK